MTFQEKLEKFKRGEVGFRVDSQEVADGLIKVFEKEDIRGQYDTPRHIVEQTFCRYGINSSVVVIKGNVVFGNVTVFPDKSFEFLELTVEELQ